MPDPETLQRRAVEPATCSTAAQRAGREARVVVPHAVGLLVHRRARHRARRVPDDLRFGRARRRRAHDVPAAAAAGRVDRPLAAAATSRSKAAHSAGSPATRRYRRWRRRARCGSARSFKYHRARGIHSFANHDVNNLLRASTACPTCAATSLPLRAGMRVARGEHARRRGARPRAIHRMAGALPARGLLLQGVSRPEFPALGAAHPRLRRARRDPCRRAATADPEALRVLRRAGDRRGAVSGLAAALAAADAGARVLLVDENARAGWQRPVERRAVRRDRPRWPNASRCIRTSRSCRRPLPRATTRTTGWRWSSRRGMTKVRAAPWYSPRVSSSSPRCFRNNDLPGVMHGFRRAAPAASLSPSRRADACASSPRTARATKLARALRAHGIDLAAPCSTCARAPVPMRAGLDGVRCLAGVAPDAALAGAGGAVRALRVQHRYQRGRHRLQ